MELKIKIICYLPSEIVGLVAMSCKSMNQAVGFWVECEIGKWKRTRMEKMKKFVPRKKLEKMKRKLRNSAKRIIKWAAGPDGTTDLITYCLTTLKVPWPTVTPFVSAARAGRLDILVFLHGLLPGSFLSGIPSFQPTFLFDPVIKKSLTNSDSNKKIREKNDEKNEKNEKEEKEEKEQEEKERKKFLMDGRPYAQARINKHQKVASWLKEQGWKKDRRMIAMMAVKALDSETVIKMVRPNHAKNRKIDISEGLGKAVGSVSGGHLVMEAILDSFSQNIYWHMRDDFFRPIMNRAMSKGHVETVKRVHEKYKVPFLGASIKQSVAKGHLSVLKYCFSTFPTSLSSLATPETSATKTMATDQKSLSISEHPCQSENHKEKNKQAKKFVGRNEPQEQKEQQGCWHSHERCSMGNNPIPYFPLEKWVNHVKQNGVSPEERKGCEWKYWRWVHGPSCWLYGRCNPETLVGSAVASGNLEIMEHILVWIQENSSIVSLFSAPSFSSSLTSSSPSISYLGASDDDEHGITLKIPKDSLGLESKKLKDSKNPEKSEVLLKELKELKELKGQKGPKKLLILPKKNNDEKKEAIENGWGPCLTTNWPVSTYHSSLNEETKEISGSHQMEPLTNPSMGWMEFCKESAAGVPGRASGLLSMAVESGNPEMVRRMFSFPFHIRPLRKSCTLAVRLGHLDCLDVLLERQRQLFFPLRSTSFQQFFLLSSPFRRSSFSSRIFLNQPNHDKMCTILEKNDETCDKPLDLWVGSGQNRKFDVDEPDIGHDLETDGQNIEKELDTNSSEMEIDTEFDMDNKRRVHHGEYCEVKVDDDYFYDTDDHEEEKNRNRKKLVRDSLKHPSFDDDDDDDDDDYDEKEEEESKEMNTSCPEKETFKNMWTNEDPFEEDMVARLKDPRVLTKFVLPYGNVRLLRFLIGERGWPVPSDIFSEILTYENESTLDCDHYCRVHDSGRYKEQKKTSSKRKSEKRGKKEGKRKKEREIKMAKYIAKCVVKTPPPSECYRISAARTTTAGLLMLRKLGCVLQKGDPLPCENAAKHQRLDNLLLLISWGGLFDPVRCYRKSLLDKTHGKKEEKDDISSPGGWEKANLSSFSSSKKRSADTALERLFTMAVKRLQPSEIIFVMNSV